MTFKNRHTPEFLHGRICRVPDGVPGEYVIRSDVKVQGIAPGQFTAIYDPEYRVCFGSGIITGRKADTL